MPALIRFLARTFSAVLVLSFAMPVYAVDLMFTQVSDLGGVVDINHAGDGSGRLFLVEQAGRVAVNQDGQDLDGHFLDITDRVLAGGERGLLSIAFAPDYATSGYFYVWYTRQDGDTVLSRFRVSGNPALADAGSEQVLLVVAQPFSNHNGGRVRFGPDGMLYLGLGDGGGANDPLGAGQDTGTLLGKLIRIDVDPQHGTYAIPPDNPFVGNATALDEIWATGLRNPWRISFDRSSGDLFIADVGQGDREEVNVQPASSSGGENYGWSVMEGSLCVVGGCDMTGLTLPVAEYDHSEGCSITGGEVYRGLAYPDLNGTYLFGDYCLGTIWGTRWSGTQWETTELANTLYSIVSFGEGEDGSVYLAAAGSGVYLISDGQVQVEPDFGINPGMNDAWFDPVTAGQGFFIVVFEDQGLVFLSWFTYDTERPPQDVTAILGEPGHRWVTAQGPYSGDTATLDVFISFGGVFDSPVPAVGPPEAHGTMIIKWNDCHTAMLTYDMPSTGPGSVPLQRIVPDNAAVCEALQ